MPSAFDAYFEQNAMPVVESQFGVDVTLQVGSKSSSTFTAIGREREYESIELETGLPIKITYRDWLLPLSALVVNGSTVVPKRGDRIIEGEDAYEIVPIQGRPAVELQQGGYRYLVHSQRVAV